MHTENPSTWTSVFTYAIENLNDGIQNPR